MKKGNLKFLWLPMMVAGVVLLGFSGCVSPYEAPKPGEPAAIVKLQYTYNSIKPGTTLRVSMRIRENREEGDFQPAYRGDFGLVETGGKPPEIPIQAVRVRPNKDSVIEMRLAFWWTTQRWVTITTYAGNTPVNQQQLVRDYHEAGCSEKVVFSPQVNKTYLMNFSNPNVDKGCSLNAFEQIPQGKEKFRLKKTGRRYTEKDESDYEPEPPKKK